MKLTKEDLMRLPKERLAEIIVEMENSPKIEYIQVPAPSIPNITPYKNPWDIGPTVTYAEKHQDIVAELNGHATSGTQVNR